MSSVMDLLTQQLGPEQMEQISQQLGVDKSQAENAVGMALPTLLGAVARKADDENEVQRLHDSLQQEDDSVFDNLSGLLGGASSGPAAQGFLGDGGGILESILGGKKSKVEDGIGKASGLSGGQAGSLMAMLAPMVLGAIGNKAKSGGGMDLGGLAGMLRGEKETMEKQATGGLLSGLLDQDGDGDFDFSDVMKLGMNKFFGK